MNCERPKDYYFTKKTEREIRHELILRLRGASWHVKLRAYLWVKYYKIKRRILRK